MSGDERRGEGRWEEEMRREVRGGGENEGRGGGKRR